MVRLLGLGALFVLGPITNKPKSGPYLNLDYCRVLRERTKFGYRPLVGKAGLCHLGAR